MFLLTSLSFNNKQVRSSSKLKSSRLFDQVSNESRKGRNIESVDFAFDIPLPEFKFNCRAFSHVTLASVLRRLHATCDRISPATCKEIPTDTTMITGTSTYRIISAKAAPMGLTTYVIPCFWHIAITSFCILYRLCRGIIGNRLRKTRLNE